MTLHEYLHQKYSPASAKCYQERINYYLSTICNARTATHAEIIHYLYEHRKHQKPSRIQALLYGIKKYYNYLVHEAIREDNPVKSIYFKDIKSKLPIVLNKLLTAEEIDQIWNYFLTKNYRYKIRKNRDISIVGLLLKQGIRRKEIEDLTPAHINLEKGEIFIPASHKTKARTLALETSQILPFYRYLNEDRPQLLKGGTPRAKSWGKIPQNKLFITKKTSTSKADMLAYLIKTIRPLIKDKAVNLSIIRMSVIAEQFRRGHALKQVQYFAGHLYPSTTERYRISYLQDLQEGIFKHHPHQASWGS